MSHIFFRGQACTLPLSAEDAAYILDRQDSGLCTYPVFVGDEPTGLSLCVDSDGGTDAFWTRRDLVVDSAEQ